VRAPAPAAAARRRRRGPARRVVAPRVGRGRGGRRRARPGGGPTAVPRRAAGSGGRAAGHRLPARAAAAAGGGGDRYRRPRGHADPLGGGVDLVLGWESRDGLRWPAVCADPGLAGPLPSRGELAVLSWDRVELLAVPPEAMSVALDTARAGRDLVVVDLPRRLDDAAVLALAAADRALLVVPAELRACAAAARVAAVAAVHARDLEVVVRGPAPGRL